MISWKVARAAIPYVVALIAVIAVLRFWSGIWAALPWSAESRAERAEAAAAAAQSDADARGLESAGNAEQVARVEAAADRAARAAAITADAIAEARSAPDATSPLDPARLDRLRRHDRQLCDNRPGSCEPAPADHPDDG